MNAGLIVVGLIAIAICCFIAVIGWKGWKWTRKHEEVKGDLSRELSQNIAGKGWFIAAAIASVVGISIFTILGPLAFIMGIIALVVVCRIEKGDKGFWSRVGQVAVFGVFLGGIGAAVLVVAALVFMGAAKPAAAVEGAAPLGNETKI